MPVRMKMSGQLIWVATACGKPVGVAVAVAVVVLLVLLLLLVAGLVVVVVVVVVVWLLDGRLPAELQTPATIGQRSCL